MSKKIIEFSSDLIKNNIKNDYKLEPVFYSVYAFFSVNINEIIAEMIPNQKWNIDTVLINKILLQRIGLLEENIIDSGLCSVCNKEQIHSFRVEKEGYGVETAMRIPK